MTSPFRAPRALARQLDKLAALMGGHKGKSGQNYHGMIVIAYEIADLDEAERAGAPPTPSGHVMVGMKIKNVQTLHNGPPWVARMVLEAALQEEALQHDPDAPKEIIMERPVRQN